MKPQAAVTPITRRQIQVLRHFAKAGVVMTPGDAEVLSRCDELFELGLMTRQTYVCADSIVGEADLIVGFALTGAGISLVRNAEGVLA